MRALFGMRRGPKPVAAPPPPYPSVQLVSWQPRDGTRNFGDHLSRIVVAAMALRSGLTLDDEVTRERRMLAIGSILHFARDGDCVWGSGVNGKIDLAHLTARDLDVRAVRGPKTAKVLRDLGMDVPDVFGDPALLVPHLFGKRFTRTGGQDFVVIPNLHDIALVPHDGHMVSPLRGWNYCISRILAADFVVASSLHGVILAEAFGVPARYLRLSETESTFKYDDYAQGTGRDRLVPASSIRDALDKGPDAKLVFDPLPLIDAFPADLWS